MNPSPSPISKINSQSVMGNISYAIKICAAMSVVGLVIKFAISSYEASLIGLGLVALSLFGTMMMVLKYYYSTGSEKSFFNGAVLPSLVQLIFICAVIAILLYQTITTTSQNITSSEYTTFSSISAMLTLMQVCITFYYLFLNMKCLNGGKCNLSEQDTVTSLGIMYFNIILTLLNACTLGIIQVILNKFYIC
jgi:hypothetical protein